MRDILNCRPATFRERALSTVTFRTLSERLPHPESTKLYGTVEFCDFFFAFPLFVNLRKGLSITPLACQCKPLGPAAERHYLLLPVPAL